MRLLLPPPRVECDTLSLPTQRLLQFGKGHSLTVQERLSLFQPSFQQQCPRQRLTGTQEETVPDIVTLCVSLQLHGLTASVTVTMILWL